MSYGFGHGASFRSDASIPAIAVVASALATFAVGVQPYNLSGISISDYSEPWPSFSEVDFLFDPVNDRYYWDGAERSLSDATDNGDGSYSGTLSTPLNMGNRSGLLEVTNPATVVTYETAFSMTNSSDHRWEMFTSQGRAIRIYDSQSVGGGGQVEGQYDYAGSFASNGAQNFERFRCGWSSTIGEDRIVRAGYVGSHADNTEAGASSFDEWSVGRRAWNSGAGLNYNGTVHMVVIFKEPKTDAELLAAADKGAINPGIHFGGDSFLSNAEIRDDVEALIRARGVYCFTSTDQTGGWTLTQFAASYVANPQWWDKTLVIIDGGLNPDTTSVAALEDIVEKIEHDRWLYVQSNPIYATGVSTRPQWDTEDAAILAYCGADHYLETKSVMQDNDDASANDLADIANDIWPRSLLDGDVVHPNASGQAVLAQAIFDRLVSEGWLAYTVKLSITAGTLTVDASTSATVVGNGSASLTISGSRANVNTELASLDIAGLTAGSYDLSVETFYPDTKSSIKKAISITVTA